MQPYSQPFFWVNALAQANTMKYWFRGLPLPGVKAASRPTGGLKYWFRGLPAPVIFGKS